MTYCTLHLQLYWCLIPYSEIAQRSVVDLSENLMENMEDKMFANWEIKCIHISLHPHLLR